MDSNGWPEGKEGGGCSNMRVMACAVAVMGKQSQMLDTDGARNTS